MADVVLEQIWGQGDQVWLINGSLYWQTCFQRLDLIYSFGGSVLSSQILTEAGISRPPMSLMVVAYYCSATVLAPVLQPGLCVEN